MAGTNLFALIDDIASVLDDVAALSKIAAKKTVGVVGDDLALNAQQVAGVASDRELPVVWAVARGSLKNKAILVPAALLISALIPWGIIPLLMIGGTFLCYEGFEKIVHSVWPTHHYQPDAHPPIGDRSTLEKNKIKGAIRTDFILSAEIIVIALGTVATASFGRQVAVLIAVAIIMTIGVYGIVAGIVKLDDGGFYLLQRRGDNLWYTLVHGLGRGIVGAAPLLMKGLSIAGTVAMFMVGGGILTHGVHRLEALIQRMALGASAAPGVGRVFAAILPTLLNALLGVVIGAVALGAVVGVRWIYQTIRRAMKRLG
jgi:uncharacterized protein